MKNEIRNFLRVILKPFCILNTIAFSAFGQQPSTPVIDPNDNPKIDKEIVDALNKRYGVHSGFRSNHAKGIVVEGSFTPTPEAAALSRSPIFAGATLPVTARFSDAGGMPDLHDAAPVANPHGMAIKLHLP